MKQYLDLMRHVRDNGATKTDRTGTGTKSVFGYQMRFNLQDGFPLVTTKQMHLRSIVHELLWFLAGDTNVKYLQDHGVKIWDEWADANGDLGPIYGHQWRSWPGKTSLDRVGGFMATPVIDQISEVLDQIKNNPDSRRMIVSAWNPADIPDMKLPPCHCLFQFYVDDLTLTQRYKLWQDKTGLEVLGPVDHAMFDDAGIPRKRLSCQLYQRSADIFLGVPFNIASYALLTHMMAQQAGMAVGDFIWTGGDCHLYSNHMDQVEIQLARTPGKLPTLLLNKAASIFDYKFDDIEIAGYQPDSSIKAPVAV